MCLAISTAAIAVSLLSSALVNLGTEIERFELGKLIGKKFDFLIS